MILEQNGVVLVHKRQHRLGKRLRARRLIRRNRGRPDEDLVLRNQPVGRNVPVMAKAVAYGGWQCTTARALGLAL
jgi:hypothetical protein